MMLDPSCVLSRFIRLATLVLLAQAFTLCAADGPLEITFQPEPAFFPVVRGRDLRFNTISNRGLSQTRVAHIVQDDRGFLWFGTQYGLNRYDGYESRVFAHRPEVAESPAGVYVSALHFDRNGVLWLASGPALDRFDAARERFTHLRLQVAGGLPEPAINHITSDPLGRLWLSTNDGLRRLDPASGAVARFAHTADDPASIGNNDIRSTGFDRSGHLWVGHSSGLDRIDPATGRVDLRLPLGESGHGLVFLDDREGNLWIIYGPDGRLARLDRTRRVLTRQIPLGLDGDAVIFNALLEDASGHLWLSTETHGLFRLDGGRLVNYRHEPGDPASLSGNRITTMAEDREGNLWLGHHQSPPQVVCPRPPTFIDLARDLRADPGTGLGLISALYQDRAGRVWIGAQQRLRAVDRSTGEVTEFLPVRGMDSLCLLEEDGGILWVGTAGGGLLRHETATGQTRRYRSDPRDPTTLPGDQVQALHRHSDGTLWLATWDGLVRFNPSTESFTAFKPRQDGRGLNFYSITEDLDGRLWLGSNLGLHRFDPSSGLFTVYPAGGPDGRGPSDNRVNSAFVDHAGILWVGTQNGLDRFDRETERFTHFTTSEGLPGNVVSAIREDADHALWLSTNRGIARFAPDRREFQQFHESDGLPGPDLTGWGASAQGHNGDLFFGGFSGAVAFRPAATGLDISKPQVTLTEFHLFDHASRPGAAPALGHAIHTVRALTLDHWQNFFAFEFSGLSYVNPAGMRYRYRLDGLDRDWIVVGSDQRRANYTALPPGRYTFQVQVSTPRGEWVTPGVELPITLTPPWWDTAEFRIGAGSLVLLLIAAGYRARIEGIKRRQREFRRLADNAPDVVMRFDQELRLSFINPRIHHYTTLSGGALLGHTCTEIAERGYALPVDASALPAVLDSGLQTLREFEQETAQGRRFFESRLIAERDDRGLTRSVLAITRDITDRKRAEAALQASEAHLADTRSALAHVSRVTTMGQLAASIAHEVSQPAAGILTNAKAGLRWLSGDPPNLDEAHLALQRIARDGERTSAVIHRLRALFQRTGHVRQPVDLNAAILEICSLLENEARKRSVTLVQDLASDIGNVRGDRIELQQVVLNLLVNGFDAMADSPAPRTLTITTSRDAQRVHVRVRDEGPGLSEPVRAALFSPFFTTKPNGLGMGLVICRSIVEAHGGELTVAAEGPGATFCFWLPVDPQDNLRVV